jgi:hypothetical protein
MLLSRFWYVIVALALGATTAGLFLASNIYNRTNKDATGQALQADVQVVGWYLNDDARRRSSLLLNVCLDDVVRGQLSKATAKADAVPKEVAQEARNALKRLSDSMPEDNRFSALLAVDQYGRVVGQVGFDQASGINNFELGGYPVVADALHGWVRDDAWVLDGRTYLVVARPVEVDTAQMPAGAVVGLRLIDASYAKQVSKRTNTAVGFFSDGTVKAKAAPEGFDSSLLDDVVSDLKDLTNDKDYTEKGKSKPREVKGEVNVVYSKIPGEAWELGAGYVVGRPASITRNPLAFLQLADDSDKKEVPWPIAGGVVFGVAFLGILFSILEHSRPLHTLRVEAQRMAKGEVDMLQVSKFRGVFRKIASDLNDGTDKVAAKGGVPRKAADLESVLGPIPAQPSMSAFSFPIEGQGSSPAAQGPVNIAMPAPAQPQMPAPKPSLPQPPAPKGMPQPPAPKGMPQPPAPKGMPQPPAPKPEAPAPESASRPMADDDDDATVVSAVPQEILDASASGTHAAVQEADEVSEWHNVFEEFVRTKKQCNEPVAGLTFEKFQTTLRKNRDQLMAKTGCKRVRFNVYIKDGRAALKASPAKT